MNDKTIVRFLGYTLTRDVREYNFAVREAAGPTREFSLSIANDAFNARRARFQDAAEICSIRLQQELVSTPEMGPCAFRVTDADLEAYRVAHSPKKHTGFPARKPVKKSPFA